LNIPVFVILLERDAARRRHVHENIVPRLPSARIVGATDYQSGGVADWLAANKVMVDRAKYRTVGDSKLACTVSHLRVWQTIVIERIPHAIVLEDDVDILDDFEVQLDRIETRLDDGCEFIHLYVHPKFQDEMAAEQVKSNAPLVPYVPPYGRSAYLLSGGGALKLAREFQTVTDHGDLMVSALAARRGIRMNCVTERLIENLGQLGSCYWGETFRSNVHVQGC
jgi:GR25 family glycosyltransferase involved in LPS biosynthesis